MNTFNPAFTSLTSNSSVSPETIILNTYVNTCINTCIYTCIVSIHTSLNPFMQFVCHLLELPLAAFFTAKSSVGKSTILEYFCSVTVYK